ncbi:Uncharacterised protein [Mycobacteroides abscessus subsp. abscessus]|nr:Uncharacterised protein [Mycobacteroides abscessus subsp. abscessus]
MARIFVAAASAMLMSSPDDATCQLSNSLSRHTAFISPSTRRTSSCDNGATPSGPGLDAHSYTRSYMPAIRPDGPSETRSWFSWVVMSFQPAFSSPTSISTGTRTSV